MNTQKNMKIMKEAHGCQYCSKPCFGLQCKDCHMKMVAERTGSCADCSKSFPAKRPDGSMRKRCFECQQKFATENLANCADCTNSFFAKRSDGSMRKRCFDCQQKFATENVGSCADCSKTFPAKRPDGSLKKRCYDCQNTFLKDNFKKCSSCDNSIRKEYTYCKGCIPVEPASSVKSGGSSKSHKCETKTCDKMTTYKFCSDCNRGFKSVANAYMISTCQEVGCGYRGKGYFKFCSEHRK